MIMMPNPDSDGPIACHAERSKPELNHIPSSHVYTAHGETVCAGGP